MKENLRVHDGNKKKKTETVKQKRTLPAKMTGKPAPAARLPTNHPYGTTAKWEGEAVGLWGR
jgi:hypothetical protein